MVECANVLRIEFFYPSFPLLECVDVNSIAIAYQMFLRSLFVLPLSSVRVAPEDIDMVSLEAGQAVESLWPEQ